MASLGSTGFLLSFDGRTKLTWWPCGRGKIVHGFQWGFLVFSRLGWACSCSFSTLCVLGSVKGRNDGGGGGTCRFARCDRVEFLRFEWMNGNAMSRWSRRLPGASRHRIMSPCHRSIGSKGSRCLCQYSATVVLGIAKKSDVIMVWSRLVGWNL